MRKLLFCILMTSAVANLWPQGAYARDPLPDPATIEIPDVSSADAKKLEKQGHKFFYFYNPSVSFSEAHEDLTDCRRHLEVGAAVLLPGYIPWVESVDREIEYGPNPYGLVGAIIGAIIAGPLERGARNNKMRMCMGPRGYLRYPLPEEAWKTLNEGDEETLILMQAKLASGSKPLAQEVTE